MTERRIEAFGVRGQRWHRVRCILCIKVNDSDNYLTIYYIANIYIYARCIPFPTKYNFSVHEENEYHKLLPLSLSTSQNLIYPTLPKMFTWLNGTATSPPIFLSLRSSKWFIVLTISLATFTDIFLYGLIVPVLPFALTSRAGIPESEVQTWISILLAVYGGALLVASPFAGWYADRSESRKVSLLVGLVLLAGSTVFLTVGNSIGVFIAGRILQGFSAAVVWVVGLALLSDTVGTQELGEHMGYVAIALSMAILLAPLLGGVVYDE